MKNGCKSDMWDCLDCRHFIPDREQLPYFREQVLSWQTKAEKFKDYPMINANALRNAELFEKIVKKLMDENQALRNECELLRGRLFLLMQRRSMK